MKKEINNWLSHKTGLKGFLAAGILYPDKTFFSQSLSPKFKAATAEKIWPILAEMGLEVVRHQRLPGSNLRWSFKRFTLHHTVRKNGTALAVLTTNKPAEDEMAEVEKLLTEFRALPF